MRATSTNLAELVVAIQSELQRAYDLIDRTASDGMVYVSFDRVAVDVPIQLVLQSVTVLRKELEAIPEATRFFAVPTNVGRQIRSTPSNATISEGEAIPGQRVETSIVNADINTASSSVEGVGALRIEFRTLIK